MLRQYNKIILFDLLIQMKNKELKWIFLTCQSCWFVKHGKDEVYHYLNIWILPICSIFNQSQVFLVFVTLCVPKMKTIIDPKKLKGEEKRT